MRRSSLFTLGQQLLTEMMSLRNCGDEIMNPSQVNRELQKGALLGIHHSVGSAVPMTSMVNARNERKEEVASEGVTAEVNSVVEEVQGNDAEGGVKLDLSHLVKRAEGDGKGGLSGNARGVLERRLGYWRHQKIPYSNQAS